MAEARPAATVLLLRPSSLGPEVLLLRRASSAGFFPNTWVFPGGRVEAADASVPTCGAVPALPAAEAAFAVAALRECLEEAGVWLGHGEPPAGLREALNARSGSLADAPALVADLGRLRWWSWWITPEEEPKRFDTRFFLAILRPDEAAVASPDLSETVQSLWMRPAEAIARAHVDDMFFAPPTFYSLLELSQSPIEALLTAPRHLQPIQPRLLRDGSLGDDVPVAILLPGDPLHPAAEPAPGPRRLLLRAGRWETG